MFKVKVAMPEGVAEAIKMPNKKRINIYYEYKNIEKRRN